MFTEFQPFARPDPFDFYSQWAFAGWPTQILFEIQELLQDRESEWLTEVAENIYELVHGDVDKLFDDIKGPSNSLAHSETWPFSMHTQPGHIGVFAALEPSVLWEKLTPPTKRWQRYAVFALMYIRDSIEILARRDKLVSDAGLASGGMGNYLPTDLNEAGALALEAMRALQIAHSLKFEAKVLSEHNRKVAVGRHDKNRSKRAEALEWADQGKHDGSAFPTIEAAAEYISGRLLKKPETQDLYKFETVKKWLIASKWKPLHKRAS